MAMVVSADEVDATMAVRPRERMDLMVGLEIANNNYLDVGIGRAAAVRRLLWFIWPGFALSVCCLKSVGLALLEREKEICFRRAMLARKVSD